MHGGNSMIMAVLNEKCERCRKAAIQAFHLADFIEGFEDGGITPDRILLDSRVNKAGDKIYVSIYYTYPETCGLSNVIYHCIGAGERFTDNYTFCNGKVELDGRPIFRKPYIEDTEKMQEDFYQEFSDIIKTA